MPQNAQCVACVCQVTAIWQNALTDDGGVDLANPMLAKLRWATTGQSATLTPRGFISRLTAASVRTPLSRRLRP